MNLGGGSDSAASYGSHLGHADPWEGNGLSGRVIAAMAPSTDGGFTVPGTGSWGA
jgi:hypothetical protein